MASPYRRAPNPARRATIAAVALSALIALACGRERASSADSARAAAPAPAIVSRAGGAACPRTGHWSSCQVRDRIDRAGLAPFDSVVESGLPALGPKPIIYRVNKAGLAIYIFADSLARLRGARLLDTTRFISSALPLTILTEATVIQNDNLLALLFSKNDHQRERVADALTAGPPQP
ncbi:MAG: hypothetical protein JWL95_225 [Gemmatimonadetes bacterium]|nr:hypothetical protein [Gemmatimonadota bacterium]